MRKFIFSLAITAALSLSYNASAQQGQTADAPDPLELAAKMVDQLERDYELDVVQAFKIDTMLQASYTSYYAEMERLTKSGVPSKSAQYQMVSDKWGDHIDKFIEQVMTDEQWAKYLKSESGRNKKRRDKRMETGKY